MARKNRKLSLKKRYQLLTRGLGWEPTYQPVDKVFPYDTFEGIHVHDWDQWQDPFRLTMDAYWKFQAKKEQKLYAVIDSFAQNNGHVNLTDARYLNAVKLFLTGVTPLEYAAHRGYVDAVSPKALLEAAVDGMLSTLDPYTQFERAREASDLVESVEGRYGGVGGQSITAVVQQFHGTSS